MSKTRVWPRHRPVYCDSCNTMLVTWRLHTRRECEATQALNLFEELMMLVGKIATKASPRVRREMLRLFEVRR